MARGNNFALFCGILCVAEVFPMTSGKEDYLKALYSLGDDGRVVSNKELSDLLQVSPPSVSEMIVKLQKDGYIDYTAYKGSRLTEKGREEASRLIRYYCLWEVFLVRCLGFKWSEAHIEAHNLEHHISAKAADRLEEFLGHPVYCPHGTPIPKKDGTRAPEARRPLIDMDIGESSHIRYCKEDSELMDYLQDLGITMNMPITCEAKEAYEGPVKITSEGKTYYISYKAARQVFVDDKK